MIPRTLFSSDHETFRDTVRKFLENEAVPHHEEWEQTGQVPKALWRKAGEQGFLCPMVSEEYGGIGADFLYSVVVSEEISRAGLTGIGWGLHTEIVAPYIEHYGSEEMKQRLLPKMVSGELIGAIAMSEPGAGSDLAGLQTRAVADGDDYVINGSKIWTSYVNHADYIILLVRTDPDSDKHHGISVLLVPMDTPGIEVREIPSVVGERYFHEVFFTDVRVPTSVRLGPEDEGWGVVSYALQYERVGAARYARAALTLDRLAEHARERGLLEDPLVVDRLAEARTLCEAARMLTYRVIDERAHDHPPSTHTQIARVANTRADYAVGELTVEILGADALEYGSFADANFRLAMTAGVAVGATEVQLNLIAARHLGLPRG